MSQKKKWFRPIFDFEDDEPPTKCKKVIKKTEGISKKSDSTPHRSAKKMTMNIDHKSWMKNFDPTCIEDLAVNKKKIQEIDEWLQLVCKNCNNDMLLLTGPVGCGKTITLRTVAAKHNIKVTEWITPLDVNIPFENGEYEFKEKQSTRFLEFIINAANFTSLIDNNIKKLVLVEDFPNTFMRAPAEFTEVLSQYRYKAKSPIVFICSEGHTDSKNTAVNMFTPGLKEQFQIHHISLNSVAPTGIKSALKRVADIINKKHLSMYNSISSDMIECVVNSSGGDVRSAVLNLHFASLKGSSQNLETSIVEHETKSKTKKKKQVANKFMSLGKDQTVSILHGIGRVLNPKVSENGSLTHKPADIIEQFLSQPSSFVNFLEENYLSHFSSIDHAERAISALSDADFLLAEWREKMCHEYGLYAAVGGMMLANKAPISAWNPVRGPKNMRVVYPSPKELQLLDQDQLHRGKVLVADYVSYCKIIDKR